MILVRRKEVGVGSVEQTDAEGVSLFGFCGKQI